MGDPRIQATVLRVDRRAERQAANAARAAEFTTRRQGGETLQQIADDHNLTRERVRQIIRTSGGPSFEDVRKERERVVTAREAAVESAIRAWLSEHPASTDRQVAAGLDLDLPDTVGATLVRRLLGRDAQKLLVRLTRSKGGVPDAELLRALKEATDDVGEPLTRVKYDRVRAAHGGLSGVRVIQRFGSWRAACQLAGVSAGSPPASRVYTTNWLDQDVLSCVADYLALDTSDGTFHGYSQWAQTVRHAPSGATLRLRFGPWSTVKAAALSLGHDRDSVLSAPMNTVPARPSAAS